MDDFNGAMPANMARPLVLRTENQILGQDYGPFRLRPNELTTIPILWRDPVRAFDWSFLDEYGKRHATTATAFKMLIGVYCDASSTKFKIVCDVDAGWRPYEVRITPVPDDYVLTNEWPD